MNHNSNWQKGEKRKEGEMYRRKQSTVSYDGLSREEHDKWLVIFI